MADDTTTDLTVHRETEFALGRLQPQNVRELRFFCTEASASGLFKTSAGRGQGVRNITPGEAFMLASQGVELGLSPLQALRELNIIDGRVDVPASVRAARICADPRVTRWDVDSTDQACTITTERRDRSSGYTVTIAAADMSQGDLHRHRDHVADWLYSRAVRRVSRQFFADLLLGMGLDDDRREPDRVLDVAVVERQVGERESVARCETCGEASFLRANHAGGVFSVCRNNHTQSPPQGVRNAIRGRSQEYITAPNERPDLHRMDNPGRAQPRDVPRHATPNDGPDPAPPRDVPHPTTPDDDPFQAGPFDDAHRAEASDDPTIRHTPDLDDNPHRPGPDDEPYPADPVDEPGRSDPEDGSRRPIPSDDWEWRQRSADAIVEWVTALTGEDRVDARRFLTAQGYPGAGLSEWLREVATTDTLSNLLGRYGIDPDDDPGRTQPNQTDSP